MNIAVGTPVQNGEVDLIIFPKFNYDNEKTKALCSLMGITIEQFSQLHKQLYLEAGIDLNTLEMALNDIINKDQIAKSELKQL